MQNYYLILSRATFCKPGSASWTLSTYNSNCCFSAKSSSDCEQPKSIKKTKFHKKNHYFWALDNNQNSYVFFKNRQVEIRFLCFASKKPTFLPVSATVSQQPNKLKKTEASKCSGERESNKLPNPRPFCRPSSWGPWRGPWRWPHSESRWRCHRCCSDLAPCSMKVWVNPRLQRSQQVFSFPLLQENPPLLPSLSFSHSELRV